MPNVDIHIRRKRPQSPTQKGERGGKPGPIDTNNGPEALSRRGRGSTFIDLGQYRSGSDWLTPTWILHREPYNTGPDLTPGTATFADSGGPATHNANFVDMTVDQLSARRPITQSTSPYYRLSIKAGTDEYQINTSSTWRGGKLSIPDNFYTQPTFIIHHDSAALAYNQKAPSLFARDIILKGSDGGVRPTKITSGNTYASAAVPFTPNKEDGYFLVPIPVQHLAQGPLIGGAGESVLVDVSAFRYRPRVDLDTPAQWIDGLTNPAGPTSDGYSNFLAACEFQSGLTEQGLWFVPENNFPSSPFQFYNVFPTTASALDGILQGRTDFASRFYESYFTNQWHTDDNPEGLLLLIIKQGSSIYYVWGT